MSSSSSSSLAVGPQETACLLAGQTAPAATLYSSFNFNFVSTTLLLLLSCSAM
jgi:hypothetical protein